MLEQFIKQFKKREEGLAQYVFQVNPFFYDFSKDLLDPVEIQQIEEFVISQGGTNLDLFWVKLRAEILEHEVLV